MNSRLNTNKKANNSKLFLVLAVLMIISGALIIYFISGGGQSPEKSNMVVRKSIRVTDPRKPKPGAPPVVKKEGPAAKAKTPAKVAAAKKAASPVKVSAPKKTRRPKKISAASTGRSLYAIHLASFNAEKYARRLERAIDRAGYNAYVTTFMKDNTNWYRVRVGFFKTKEDASKTSVIISKRFKQPGAWLVRPTKTEIEKNKI